MLINTFLDTEDFVHLYYEDEPVAQGCGAGARMASKMSQRPPSPAPDYSQVATSSSDMTDGRDRCRAPPQPEPPPHRVKAADLYPKPRTHFDEPGLDVGFSTICGEYVQWVGRLEDGGTVAMSNYRLHAQPRNRSGNGESIPLRLIDAVEIRELLHLVILCKHGRQLKCSFATGEQCVEWWRRLNTVLSPLGSVEETFAAAYAAWAKEQPPTTVHRALLKEAHTPQKHWFFSELQRLEFLEGNAWRVSTANIDYKLCSSYPPRLVVPASIGDEDLDSVARFRAMRRIPAVVWRHKGNGAVIARSSQPEVGWLGWRNSEDERLLAAFVTATTRSLHNKQTKLLIVDARSYASAVTNRARGGGCECQQYYPTADIQFMCLANIHNVRRSFQQMRALTAEPSDQTNWHSNVERTLWLQYVSGVCRAACVVARAVLAGRPVLVHCSDGWDRTPQIVGGAQVILDPYYRTIEGFRVLIEREWLDFGHKFADRCGHQFGPEEPNERSPIFLQWLDVIHQIMMQNPCAFEFNEAYLVKLAVHVHSCLFGTFLCNSGRERHECRLNDTTLHIWQLLTQPHYRNHLYRRPGPNDTAVIWPEYGVRHLRVWWALWCEPAGDEPHEPDPPSTNNTQQHNGLMTKTRSCDNLLNEGEKRMAQRRCSDPSLAPDVMKLSLVVSGECRALTDSCVDELPALNTPTNPPNHHIQQVVGLHPDHFESELVGDTLHGGEEAGGGAVCGTSPASSLERELGSAASNHVTFDIHNDRETPPPADSQASKPALMSESVIHVEPSSGCEVTAEDQADFVCTDVDAAAAAQAALEAGRTRHVSITWRSISESSNHSSIPSNHSSSGFDIPDGQDKGDSVSRESTPIDNHNSTEEDEVNHNVITNGKFQSNGEVITNGVNGVDDVSAKFLEVDLNGTATSSSMSSSSEGEATRDAGVAGARGGRRGRVASQLTLCPASPRRPRCKHCRHSTVGVETSGSSSSSGSTCWCGVCGGPLCGSTAGAARCSCGSGAEALGGADPLDGLPPANDPLQARLHQIILHQKRVVEDLNEKLAAANEALRRAAPHTPPTQEPPPDNEQMSNSTVVEAGRCASTSGSTSSSSSECEVGEEARSVVWLPDAAAPRCQYCRNHFWLARRRHHCRRCGGIFCGSCSEMSSWGDCGPVRVCRRCRALR